MKKWVSVNESYLSILRSIEPRIPFTNYGDNRFKPFFSPLFELDSLCYVTQVSSPKRRHVTMKSQKDFKKIFDKSGKLICVVNLNYMFPAPTCILKEVNYGNIQNFRTFKNDYEKSQYIRLLRFELSAINNMNLTKDAKYIYELKYNKPYDVISKRCFDFKVLEIVANDYLLHLNKKEPMIA